MKRKRPSRHTRIVKTKKGRKKVLINKNILKHKKIRGVIRPLERKAFKQISDPSVFENEFGGAIDFNKKGNVENINLIPGHKYWVEVPPDYEVQYHTHPDKTESPPSPEDILALLKNKNQQAEIIFRNGHAFTIIKTPSTRALSKLPATQLKKNLDKAFYSAFNPRKNSEKRWKKKLEEMGFLVRITPYAEKNMAVDINPVESKVKK
mgnify:FL=1